MRNQHSESARELWASMFTRERLDARQVSAARPDLEPARAALAASNRRTKILALVALPTMAAMIVFSMVTGWRPSVDSLAGNATSLLALAIVAAAVINARAGNAAQIELERLTPSAFQRQRDIALGEVLPEPDDVELVLVQAQASARAASAKAPWL